ncbi:MAG TPA: CsbD family protein [Verrucomicrobiae bacterium]|nr:CsbD family protein [Verrucomicrobiae bacterium]
MNWDQIGGNWKQLKGALRERWGKLTDDDLTVIAGQRDKFIGKVQERYGIAKEEAQRMADEWAAQMKAPEKSFGGGGHA